jgi:hypothetical protein
VFVVVSRVAGQGPWVRDLALLIVRHRARGTPRSPLARSANFVFTVANATPALGSFWVRGIDRRGFARIFAVRDMLSTAVANWGRYLRVLRAVDALAAAARPTELGPPPGGSERRVRRPGPMMWTGGSRPTRREQAISHLLVDALAHPLQYAEVKRNPLIAQFIARDLGNPPLARRWRTITATLPLHVPDRYAAAAQEEAQFTRVVAPRLSRDAVTMSDSPNSSSQLGEDDPRAFTVLSVKVLGGGHARVTAQDPVYGSTIDCGYLTSNVCTWNFASGVRYETLAASASDQLFVVDWSGCDQVLPSGDCKILVGGANRTVDATFTFQQPPTSPSPMPTPTPTPVPLTPVPLVPLVPPFPSFTISPNPALPTSQVTFDGSGSIGLDAPIGDYKWSFSTGLVSDSLGDAQFTHTFGCFGTITVTLTVTGTDGQAAATSHDLVISPRPGFGPCHVDGKPSIVTIAGNGRVTAPSRAAMAWPPPARS